MRLTRLNRFCIFHLMKIHHIFVLGNDGTFFPLSQTPFAQQWKWVIARNSRTTIHFSRKEFRGRRKHWAHPSIKIAFFFNDDEIQELKYGRNIYLSLRILCTPDWTNDILFFSAREKNTSISFSVSLQYLLLSWCRQLGQDRILELGFTRVSTASAKRQLREKM